MTQNENIQIENVKKYFNQGASFSGVFLCLSFALLILGVNVSYGNSSNGYVLDKSSFVSYSLGDVCYSLSEWESHLPCNPAFIAFTRPRSFFISLMGASDLRHYEDINSLVNKASDKDTVQRVFDKGNSYESFANVEMGYYANNFGVSLSPARYYIYDYIRNPVLPKITLLALREQNLNFELGSFLNPEWAFGVSTRIIKRRFIYQEIYLTELWAEGGNNLLLPIEQVGVYLEPGLVYSPEDLYWNPQFTATVVNFGVVDRVSPAFTTKPGLHLGSSIEQGGLKFGIDSNIQDETETIESTLRAAAILTVGWFRANVSLGQQDYVYGTQIGMGVITFGASHLRKTLTDPFGHKDNLEENYFNLNLVFSN